MMFEVRDERYLVPCPCGVTDCGRVIDRRDGSIYPLEDTGFRFEEMDKFLEELSR